MEVKALKSFATIYKTATVGEIFEVESEQLATDLIESGYVEAIDDVVSPEKPADDAAKAAAEKERKAAEKKATAAAKRAAAAAAKKANETK